MAEGSGDKTFGDHAAVLLRTWYLDPATSMNPNLDYAQVNPGRTKLTGTGIIDTVAMIGVPDAIILLAGSKSLSSEDLKGLRDWFGKYADWLLQSEKGKLEAQAENNHGVWYAAQAATYALFAGRWRKPAKRRSPPRWSRMAECPWNSSEPSPFSTPSSI